METKIDWDSDPAALIESVIGNALSVGGELSAEERSGQSGPPVWSIVDPRAADANYVTQDRDGNEISGTRAGWFRLGTTTEPEKHTRQLGPFVLVHATIGPTLWREGLIACKGFGTKGFFEARALPGGMFPAGTECYTCPMNSLNKPVDPKTGQPLPGKETCKGSLAMFVWFPEDDPDGMHLSMVVFSSMSIKPFRTFLGNMFESKGAKFWSVLAAMRTKFIPATDPSMSGSYIPDFRPIRALTADEFSVAVKMREQALSIIRTASPQSASQGLTAPNHGSMELPEAAYPTRALPMSATSAPANPCSVCGSEVPAGEADRCRSLGEAVTHPKCRGRLVAKQEAASANNQLDSRIEDFRREYFSKGHSKGLAAELRYISTALNRQVKGYVELNDDDWNSLWDYLTMPQKTMVDSFGDPFED